MGLQARPGVWDAPALGCISPVLQCFRGQKRVKCGRGCRFGMCAARSVHMFRVDGIGAGDLAAGGGLWVGGGGWLG
eukprot:12333290-Alexandrium_andersonii.AAC.1